MVCSSQNSFPHFRQLTHPLVAFSRFPHDGSKQVSYKPRPCQWSLAIISSASKGLAGSGVNACEGAARGRLAPAKVCRFSFDSKTSRPFSFWFKTASGWNRFALSICVLNQSLTSSCRSSSRFWCTSSRCLDWIIIVRKGGGWLREVGIHLFNCRSVTCSRIVSSLPHLIDISKRINYGR